MLATSRQSILLFPVRRLVAALAAALLLVVAACPAAAAAAPDEELQNGRLGYRWTPEPPKQPTSRESQLAWDITKYGGGGLLALWFLRRLLSSD